MALARLAAAQHGVVGHGQLLGLGLSPQGIQRRLAAGRLHRLHKGVYLVGHPALPPRAREMAAQLACEPRAVISHRSAAALWRLVGAGPDEPVDVTVVARRVHHGTDTCVHCVAELADRDRVRQGRLWLMTPARTVLDLASVLRPWELESAIAQARRRRLVAEEELLDQVERNRGRRGVARLRTLLELEGGPAFTRSGAERLMLVLVRRHGLPVPRTNVQVAGREVDLLWPQHKLVVETDGGQWHSDPLAFETDRTRDAELVALGYVVIRVTWRQLNDHPEVVANRLRRALAARGPAP